MSKFETRITAVTVLPEGEQVFSDRATRISIEDYAAGEFVVVRQTGGGCNSIGITKEEWPALRQAIDEFVARCRD